MILEEERINYSLKLSFTFPYNPMQTRIKRNSLSAKGRQSPFTEIEPKLLLLVKSMNNIKRSLTLAEGVSLTNGNQNKQITTKAH